MDQGRLPETFARSILQRRKLRIEIALLPLRGAREQLEAAIARANIPREAVAIDVGCRTGALWRLDNMGRDPSKKFLRAITDA